MTTHRRDPRARTLRCAAGVAAAVAFGVLTPAALAGAQPLPTPVPGTDGAPPPPGQPMAVPVDPAVAAPPPPPAGPPMVPEIPNAQYGSGDGPLGFLRDAWHQARDPYGFLGTADMPNMPPAGSPPPGAGPPPPLPPGFKSLNAPGSETAAAAPQAGGPALPPGYYPVNGPMPPGYEWGVPPPPPPPDPNAPKPYVPVVSPPPPPLFPTQ
ncbi:hypothetical protein GR927_08720 [Mycolicibacterium sp. 3033]|nr:hypothetical protein [Mycolicibacterium aurantiacum]